jgi:hypothetical protein
VDFETASKSEVWRGRGRPRRQVPVQVQTMADKTYRTGQVGIVTVDDDEEDELRELLGFLNSYATSLGRRIRVQREENVVRFEMVDIIKRKKIPA